MLSAIFVYGQFLFSRLVIARGANETGENALDNSDQNRCLGHVHRSMSFRARPGLPELLRASTVHFKTRRDAMNRKASGVFDAFRLVRSRAARRSRDCNFRRDKLSVCGIHFGTRDTRELVNEPIQ